MKALILSVAAIAICSASIGGCNESNRFSDSGEAASNADSNDATSDALTLTGIERVIPMRFVEALAKGGTPAATLDAAEREVAMANALYKEAGIQFRVRSVEAIEMPNIAGGLEQATLLTWSQVSAEIQKVYPGVPANAYSGQSQTADNWLALATLDYGSPDEIQVWMGRGTFNYSGSPTSFDSLYMVASGLGSGDSLSHELGHYFGLPHTFDGGAGWNDVRTLEPIAPEDRWDLYYCPAHGTTGDTFFRTRADAVAAKATCPALALIETQSNCTVDATLNVVACNVNGTVYHTGDWQVRGLTKTLWDPSGAQVVTKNIMSYMSTPDGAKRHLGDSAVEIIRRAIHYDVKTIGKQWPGKRGGRVTLGTGSLREPTFNLDFDGDGRRDLAFWSAPGGAAANATGHFRVLLSSAAYALSGAMEIDLGSAGDIPLPADTNGDGRADFVLFHPGSGREANSQATWSICKNRLGEGAIGRTSCAPGLSGLGFGEKEDVPMSGLDFNNDKASELMVYRPRTGDWYWADSPSFTAWHVVRPVAGMPRNVQPMPGHYDGDGLPDLVLYDPNTATFHLTSSTTGWQSTVSRTLPAASYLSQSTGSLAQRATSTPITNMYVVDTVSSQGQGGSSPAPTTYMRRALALWNNQSGRWGTLWNPLASGALSECIFGIAGDRPIGGLGVSLQSGAGARNYPSVYRITDSAIGQLWSISPTSLGCGTYSSVNQGTVRNGTSIFSVADMTGDGMPDLVQVNPELGGILYYDSPSYSTPHSVSYGNTWMDML